MDTLRVNTALGKRRVPNRQSKSFSPVICWRERRVFQRVRAGEGSREF